MKKTLLVFLALALVSSFAFAELSGVGEATVSGSVSLTAGYDLDNESYGFVNDSDLTVTLPILGGTDGVAGDDGIYGEIVVDDLGWDLQNGGYYDLGEDDDGFDASGLTASISATLYFNDFYVGLGAPDFEVDNVDVSDDYDVDAHADAVDATGGFTLGFKNDMIDIALLLASENDYRDSSDDEGDTEVDLSADFFGNVFGEDEDTVLYTPNVDGDLVFGVEATITPSEGVTIPVKFMFDAASNSNPEDLMAFGMAPSVEIDALTFDMPFDYVSYGDISGFEMEPSVAYAVMEGFEVSATLLFGSYTDVVGAATATLIENSLIEFTLGLADTEAFVPGLEWTLDVTGYDLGDYMAMELDILPVDIDVTASYNMDGMKPYMETGYSLYAQDLYLDLGVELDADFTGIDNTVVTILYSNDSLVNSANAELPGDDDLTESGRITVDVTVSF